jgi:hypothetical protein
MRSRSYAAVVHDLPFGPHEGVQVGIVAESEVPNGVFLARLVRDFPVEVVAMLHKLVKLDPDVKEMEALLDD